jgi:hypothetical protein
MGVEIGYPLVNIQKTMEHIVNVYITNWKITIFHGKINCKWPFRPFSIAFCTFTRGYPQKPIAVYHHFHHEKNLPNNGGSMDQDTALNV